jgi:hypothetical protein
MITIPNTKNGHTGMVLIKETYHAIYYLNGSQRRKSTSTGDLEKALNRRNEIYAELINNGATIKRRKTQTEKIITDKRDLYVYSRPPYQFVLKGKVIFESWNKQEVVAARDGYFKIHER